MSTVPDLLTKVIRLHRYCCLDGDRKRVQNQPIIAHLNREMVEDKSHPLHKISSIKDQIWVHFSCRGLLWGELGRISSNW